MGPFTLCIRKYKFYFSLSERISESDFELPELPFRAMKYGKVCNTSLILLFRISFLTNPRIPVTASLDDRRSLDASSLLSWIDSAEQLYSALGQ